MNEVIVFPPETDALIGYLRTALADLDDTAEVHGRVPNPRPARFVTLRRGGGVRANLVVDRPTILVEAWGPDDDAAYDLAQLVRASLFAVAGTTQGGVRFYRVGEFGGPANLPDPDSDQARFVFTLTFGVRGTALP